MNVEEKVKDILFELSGMEITENDAMLQEELGMDSISMVTMLVEIEEIFDIELDESDMNPFDLTTVQNVIDMVGKYRSDKNE